MGDDPVEVELSHVPVITHDVIGHRQFTVPRREQIGQVTDDEDHERQKMDKILHSKSGIVTQSTPHVKKSKRSDQIEKSMGIREKGHECPGIGIKECE
jgi:hypothetical protein